MNMPYKVWCTKTQGFSFVSEPLLPSQCVLVGFSPVMQFTGIVAKNGDPVYEGDIIRVRIGPGVKEVKHDLVVKDISDGNFTLGVGGLDIFDLDVEAVIGNYYDNCEFDPKGLESIYQSFHYYKELS